MEYIVDEILGLISYLNLAYLDKKWAELETSLATFICCVYEAFSTVARSRDNQSRGYVTNKRP